MNSLSPTDEKSSSSNGERYDILNLYKEVQQQQKRNRLLLWIGALCVCGILGAFVLRVMGLLRDYWLFFSHLNPAVIFTNVEDTKKEIILSDYQRGYAPHIQVACNNILRFARERLPSAGERFQEELLNVYFPDFLSLYMQKLAEKEALLQKEIEKILEQLTVHLETSVKTQIEKSLDHSARELQKEILTAFPEINWEQFNKELLETYPYFWDRLHEQGVLRIARFAPFLDALKSHTESLYKRHKPSLENREEILDEFLIALCDRLKYELVPWLGNEPAESETKTSDNLNSKSQQTKKELKK